MSYAKLALDGLTIPAKIQYARRLGAAINSNPYFPAPSPSPVQIITKADELEAGFNEALAARLASKTKTGLLDDQSAGLDLLISQLASYVDNASAGDAAKIESAGFAIRATPRPFGELAAPTDLQVSPSQYPGSADMRWKKVTGAKAYLVERAADGPALNWQLIGTSTKGEAAFNSMVSGTKYWFRVAAVGTAGQSPWSDAVPLFAP